MSLGIILANLPIPVHDWTIRTANGIYGLYQYRDFECEIWFGSPLLSLPFSAPVVAAGFLLILLLLLFAAWHFIGKLRDKAAPGDA